MLEEPIKSRTEIQKEKKKSVWYTESVHQIIARSTKSRTEIQEKKKKSVQRTGTCQNTPEYAEYAEYAERARIRRLSLQIIAQTENSDSEINIQNKIYEKLQK